MIKAFFRYTIIVSLLVVALMGCERTTVSLPITENDLVGVWRSEDYLQPIIFTIDPDLSYTVAMEEADSISLSNIGKTNMMLLIVAAHPTGSIEVNSPREITFIVTQDDGNLRIQGTVISVSDSEITCVLGAPENDVILLTKQ